MSTTTTRTFADLGVPDFICTALEQRGITQPFDIQAATIADGLAGRDVCGRAPTGSGKTLAFGVPLVATTERAGPHAPTALVLAPTRELAEQITTELRSFAGRLRIDAVYGGVGYGKQLNALRRGVDVLVACPGRLEDLIERGDVRLDRVQAVVLDEADRMADMGFMPSVRRLLDQTSPERRTMLFSATLDGDVAELTRKYQHDPVRHEVGEETPDVTAATHRFINVERPQRNAVVADVINGAWPSIVFTRTRHGADRLARQLGKLGFQAAPIHGGLSQNARQRALDNFANNRVHALIATDVAARGIHVDGVASVVHYDPPEDHKTYVHRAGRTARAGAEGLVVSLVQPDQRTTYRRMQREIGLDAEVVDADVDQQATPSATVPDVEPVRAPRPAPKQQRSGGQQHRGRSAGHHRGQATPKQRRPDGHRRDDHRDDRRDDRESVDGHRRHGARRDDARGDDRDPRARDGKPGGPKRSSRATGKGSGSQQGGPKRTKPGNGPTGSGPKPGGPKRSGKPKANNRKARRAHLQWDR